MLKASLGSDCPPHPQTRAYLGQSPKTSSTLVQAFTHAQDLSFIRISYRGHMHLLADGHAQRRGTGSVISGCWKFSSLWRRSRASRPSLQAFIWLFRLLSCIPAGIVSTAVGSPSTRCPRTNHSPGRKKPRPCNQKAERTGLCGVASQATRATGTTKNQPTWA